MTNSIFKENEPQILSEIGIDYEYLDYYKGSLSNFKQNNNDSSEIQQQSQVEIAILSQYFAIKTNTGHSLHCQTFYWAPISEFDYKCYKEQSNDCNNSCENNHEIQFSHQEDSSYIITIMFQSQQEMLNFENEIYHHCVKLSTARDEGYIFIKNVGKGTQATIDLYQNCESPFFSQKFAVKTYKLIDGKHKQTIQEMIKNEIKFLRELYFSENVIQLERVFKTNNQFQLEMNFASAGTLRDFIIRALEISEIQIRSIMQQLLLTIDLFHQQNIIHRDIKPDNILISDLETLNLCIGDLGFACRSDDMEKIRFKCGTPGFMDPSVFKGQPFSKTSDIFSLGSLLFNLITRKSLFSGRSSREILLKNQSLDPQTIIDSTCTNVSKECRDLLKQMVNYDQQKRPTAEECLNHPWFSLNQDLIKDFLSINKIAYTISLNQIISFQASPKVSFMGDQKNLQDDDEKSPMRRNDFISQHKNS